MSKVAKLVYYSLVTRVVVDKDASDDEIIKATYPKIFDKLHNQELGENLEEIIDDEECPFGTFETDDPSIDRVILNVGEKQYIVIGKGIPVQVIKFDNFTDWDSVQNTDGVPVFDIQIDDDGQFEDGTFVDKNSTHPYTFQYVDLHWRHEDDNWEVGDNYQGVKVELTTTPLAQVVVELFTKK